MNISASSSRAEVDATVALQPRFSEPRSLIETYAGDRGRAGKQTGMVVGQLDARRDRPTRDRSLALSVLEHILVGTPASPLRKALTDSGLGEGLTGSGIADDYAPADVHGRHEGHRRGRWRQGRGADPRNAAQAGR